MADTVKISALTEIASGALDDNSVVPVVDGGTTYKLPITKLKTFIGDSFATDTELSNQISVVNSTISGLDTGDISENGNLYYTDTRVKTKLNAEGVVSGSAQVTISYDNLTDIPDGLVSSSTQISASAAAAGFGAGGGTTIPDGTISGSEQISDLGFIESSVTSSMTVLSASHAVFALTASYAENAAGGGGGSSDYISNITLSDSTLTFTGVGSAFNSTINLAIGGGDGGNLVTTSDLGNYVDSATYESDSGSFDTRINSLSAGAVPEGTVSSSAQVVLNDADKTGFDTDDVPEGITGNRLYYSDTYVLDYINSISVVSGSGAASANGIVSSSEQIQGLGFTSDIELNASSSTLQTNIDNLAADAVSVGDINDFTDLQKFRDIQVTGSIKLTNGSFSGSGAELFNIPAAAVIGDLTTITDELVATGTTNKVVVSAAGLRVDVDTGSFDIYAGNDIKLHTGSFSGSGALLFDIPQSAIIGGVGGSGFGDKIVSGSSSASIDTDYLFKVNTGSVFDGDMVVSGSIIADEISVGTAGTPTLFSSTNINLSASNAVVITDSPLRMTPHTDAIISTYTLSTGDIVYNSTDNDLYVRRNNQWVSLTFTGSDGSAPVELGGTGVITGSQQIADLGAGIVSSSQQIVSERSILNTELVIVDNGELTGSSNLSYNIGTDLLSAGNISTTDITYTGTIAGPAGSTGSFSRLEADSLGVNNILEFPSSDGTANQVLKTDGAGNIGFATVETLVAAGDITTTGTITMGTGSVDDNLTVGGTINSQTISTGNTVIESTNIRLQSGGQLLLSSSNEDLGVVIDDVLVLPERVTFPASPRTGSIVVSASASGPRPFFYDGTAWTQMFA